MLREQGFILRPRDATEGLRSRVLWYNLSSGRFTVVAMCSMDWEGEGIASWFLLPLAARGGAPARLVCHLLGCLQEGTPHHSPLPTLPFLDPSHQRKHSRNPRVDTEEWKPQGVPPTPFWSVTCQQCNPFLTICGISILRTGWEGKRLRTHCQVRSGLAQSDSARRFSSRPLSDASMRRQGEPSWNAAWAAFTALSTSAWKTPTQAPQANFSAVTSKYLLTHCQTHPQRGSSLIPVETLPQAVHPSIERALSTRFKMSSFSGVRVGMRMLMVFHSNPKSYVESSNTGIST